MEKQTSTAFSSVHGTWTFIGLILLAAAIGLLTYASNLRPTIEVPIPSSLGIPLSSHGEEVFDAGLLQQQMMIFAAGLCGLVLAAIALATASILKIVAAKD